MYEYARTDMPISFPGLFGDWSVNPDPVAIPIGNGVRWYGIIICAGLILAVLFFVKVGTAYMDYRKHGQIEWAPPVILFACLVFMLTAPLYIWGIIGI